MIPRETVVAEARRWLDVRWEHQGRSAHGLDCVGLVVMVCRALGISDYDLAAYPREPVASNFVHHFIAAGGTRIPIPDVSAADLLLFRDARFPCHVAMLTGPARLIHAHATRRKVIEEPLGDWRGKWVAAIQMPGVG